MGELRGWLFEPSFNRSVKVLATDERLTSDSGLLLLREADHRLGITESLAQRLDDPCRPDRIRYQRVELVRERIYALAMGYSAQDDADRRDARVPPPAERLAAHFSGAGLRPQPIRRRPGGSSGRLGRVSPSCP